jgi:iron-sulfur cluster repair protein YtfE (RIC family)
MTTTPKSFREEHAELRQFVARLTREKGGLGEQARRLARLLETHMQKEENFAAPPLGLLPRLARGDVGPGMADALAHSDWLRRNLEVMHAEHQMIAAALEELLKAAGPVAPPELVTFAETLLNHARLEEEVLYPAAIVAGEYLKLRLAERASITAV